MITVNRTRSEVAALGLTDQAAVRRLRAAGLEIVSALLDDKGDLRVTVEDPAATEAAVSTALARKDPPPTPEETTEAEAERLRLASADPRLPAALAMRAWTGSTHAERTWADGVIAAAAKRIRSQRA